MFKDKWRIRDYVDSDYYQLNCWCIYQVEKKLWWFPFWFQIEIDFKNTEVAREFYENISQEIKLGE